MSSFSGMAVATVTPFNNGEIDFDAYDRYLTFLREKGIKNFAINGSTGEPHALSLRERLSLLEFARKKLPHAYILGGICSTNTYSAIEEGEYIASLKIDSLLLITPFCSKCTDDGIIKHFKEIKKHSELDIIAYNVPSRTSFELLPSHVEILAKEGIIQGVKQASNNIESTALFSLYTDVFSGDDSLIAYTRPFIKGVISVLGNVYPEAVQALLTLDLKNAVELQGRLRPLISSLFKEVNPVMIKYLLSKLNVIRNQLRLPLTEGKAEDCERLLQEGILAEIPYIQI